VLAELNTNDLVAQLHQAEANVKIQQAKLDSLQVSVAKQTLSNDYNNVPIALNVAYSNADDAVLNQADQFLHETLGHNAPLFLPF